MLINSQFEFLSDVGRLVDQFLEVLFGVRGQSCDISKQHFFHEDCTHFGLNSQAVQLEQFSIASSI